MQTPFFWWAGVDSNHRRRKSTDLQSVAFGRSATYPNGAGDRNRTNNLLITSQLLYLLSYTSIDKTKTTQKNVLHIMGGLNVLFLCLMKIGFGAAGRNRTTDTGIFSPLLYRLSYRGIENCFTKKAIFGDSNGVRTHDL